MKKLLLVGLASALLVGCSAPAALNFTPTDLAPVTPAQKINSELKTISVSIATKEEQKGELQVGFMGNDYEQSFKTTFKDSLEDSFARTAIFSDDASNKLSLSAKILRFETPGMGFTFDTKLLVRYDFIDRKKGISQYVTEIESDGSVPLDYAFMGAIRATEARNRAVKANIQKLINDLKLNTSKFK
ncbi:UDP-N-acetylglucosamine acyltransferase [Conservatibacter flavescens]|uniref:UDP-N-acetylglucosamine acyltransferase n=2 Tax=Conservatibacter flavescens TaxID=28161 RepID=A0A2M8S635_9PAST|nr:UDP-N-acetylglucosamine acyltransferase [Conservatibacter flavescens]